MYNNYEERIELLNKQLVTEYKKNDKLEQENKQLQERIEKALEYLDKEFPWEDGQPEDIYKILKGENNE